MMVSLSAVLTTIAVAWLVIIVIVCLCDSKSDKENVTCCLFLLMTIFSGGILMCQGVNLLFSVIGG